MKNKLIHQVEKLQINDNLPVINIGDKIAVSLKISEGKKNRIQIFEGIVIAKKGSGLSKNIRVRKISYGVGVEKVFPVYSPVIKSIKIIKSHKVRRAKLYYLRKLFGKSARLKEKNKINNI